MFINPFDISKDKDDLDGISLMIRQSEENVQYVKSYYQCEDYRPLSIVLNKLHLSPNDFTTNDYQHLEIWVDNLDKY